METIVLKTGDILAKKNDKVMSWYIIQTGSIVQRNEFVETELGPNAIIGILDQDWFICDYIAKEDSALIAFECSGVDDLSYFLNKEPRMRGLFIKTSMIQRNSQFNVYKNLYTKAEDFTNFLEDNYQFYLSTIEENRLNIINSLDYKQFDPLEVSHRAQDWELASSASLTNKYLAQFMQLYTQDDAMCIGAIMEASAQMRRVTQGLGEMIDFFLKNRDVLISDSGRDLFHGLIDLQANIFISGKDTSTIESKVAQVIEFAKDLGIYSDSDLMRWQEESLNLNNSEITALPGADEDFQEGFSDMETIINFAGLANQDKENAIRTLLSFSQIYTKDLSKDKERMEIRKNSTKLFFDLYKKCFYRAVDYGGRVPAVVLMFLNFGYLDKNFLDDEKVKGLLNITNHLELCNSSNIFTIYEWLKQVYSGQKEPSKNEFDQDYSHYLKEEYKQGRLSQEQVEKLSDDLKAKCDFEIDNMFASVNRITYGSVIRYNPILNSNNLFNDPDKMLVTKNVINKAINDIRKIDFSAFYRPVYSHGLKGVMAHENLMIEILPDIILMPNAGNMGMMWQETSNAKSDSPARFMLPIFTSVDVNDMLTELTGKYRWEICRKIQGARWNDVTEHSLTSEYYDYLQFYRKNRDLSSEVKENIKNALARNRNSFRDVFAKDYLNWIKYEAKGGFRLNKFARNIMFTYCPFSKEYRSKLIDSPAYNKSIERYNNNASKNLKRINSLYDKYEKDGNEISPAMKESLSFYQM